MIDHDLPPAYFSPIKVVNSQDRGSLVLVGEESEASGTAGFAVTGQAAVDHLTELGENDDQVPFIHSVVEPSDEDVGGVLVLMMPGSIDWYEVIQLALSQPLDVLDLVHFN